MMSCRTNCIAISDPLCAAVFIIRMYMENDGMESIRNQKRKTELLSPAGTMECLRAAVAAGADAIYLGGQQFGARAFAGNFSDEELLEALKLAHFFGRKIYLTINTLTKDRELEELIPWLTPFYEAGLDGVIIQDLGVLSRCREAFPEMELHASTQMTVTESRAALFLKSLGVSRVVPARELSLFELIEMKRKTGMELETFIHGALCYCYSGQCLFSGFLGGRSGNRGRCAQPCRLPYRILQDGSPLGKKEAVSPYPLSLKDLCALPFLPDLLDAGIDSLKIEGRMKSPEYVAGVTAAYRKYIDLYEKRPDAYRVDPEDLKRLAQLYLRSEQSDGYYRRHNGREMVTPDRPGYTGCPEGLADELRKKYLDSGLTRPVDLKAVLRKGEPARLEAFCGGVRAMAEGMVVQRAQSRPLDEAAVARQLAKAGGSRFCVRDLQIEMERDLFLPVSALNELRRRVLDALYANMACAGRRPTKGGESGTGGMAAGQSFIAPERAKGAGNMKMAVKGGLFFAFASDPEQALETLTRREIRRLYAPCDAFLSESWKPVFGAVSRRKLDDPDFSFFLTLPVILRSYSEGYLLELEEWLKADPEGKKVDGMMACGLSGLTWLRQIGWDRGIALQHTAYVFNRAAYDFYERYFHADSYTASLELNRRELEALPAKDREMVVYGRAPMMISAGCVKKTAGICKLERTQENLAQSARAKRPAQGDPGFSLQDRYQARFPIRVDCRHCMNIVYNSVPLSLHQYLKEIEDSGAMALRLDFTVESRTETQRVLDLFFGRIPVPEDYAYTTGHYKKGVQ